MPACRRARLASDASRERREPVGSAADGLPVALPPLPTQRFSEVRGQDHVVTALRNAVREDRVGPRLPVQRPAGHRQDLDRPHPGQGAQLREPRSTASRAACASRASPSRRARRFDLQELDAASNNRVEDVRDLIERVALGTPGRTKVYILDEVHMLSTAASNALLEDARGAARPRRVRAGHHRSAEGAAHHPQPHPALRVPPAAGRRARPSTCAGSSPTPASTSTTRRSTTSCRQGGGSARDTLSALDQVVAAGGVLERRASPSTRCSRPCVAPTPRRALAAVADAVAAGRDPRVLGEALLGPPARRLPRCAWAPTCAHLLRRRARAGRGLGRAARRPRQLTRALEVVGDGAARACARPPDPRIPLEVALVRITQPDAGRLDRRAWWSGSSGSSARGSAAASPAAPARRTGAAAAARPTPASGSGRVGHRRPTRPVAAPTGARRRSARPEPADARSGSADGPRSSAARRCARPARSAAGREAPGEPTPATAPRHRRAVRARPAAARRSTGCPTAAEGTRRPRPPAAARGPDAGPASAPTPAAVARSAGGLGGGDLPDRRLAGHRVGRAVVPTPRG